MSGVSEAELHVQAMRLVCEALADREQQGLEVDWRVLYQQLDQMDAILQSIDQKHRYDSSEIVDLRRERDAAYEQVSTVRDEVAAEIESLRKDRDHWKAAREDAIEAGELMQAEIVTLRQQLADAQREASDEFVERQVLTAEQQQRDEIAYLRDRLDEERSVSARLQKKLAAAEAAVSLQRSGIERLQVFVGKVRSVMDRQYDGVEFDDLSRALAELDAGTSEPEGGK